MSLLFFVKLMQMSWVVWAGAAPTRGVPVRSAASELSLEVSWRGEGGERHLLKQWSWEEILALKRHEAHERHPRTGTVERWRGVRMTDLLDASWGNLDSEKKASVDLLVLTASDGNRAMIPREFAIRYPYFLAYWIRRERLGDEGPFFAVVPWTSLGQFSNEPLPLETYVLPRVVGVELTSYRAVYGAALLIQRSDPHAAHGEKVFLKTCMGCHARAPWPKVDSEIRRLLNRGWNPQPHRDMPVTRRISESVFEKMVRYFRSLKNTPDGS